MLSGISLGHIICLCYHQQDKLLFDIKEKVVFYIKIQHISLLTAATFYKERDLVCLCVVYHASGVCRINQRELWV